MYPLSSLANDGLNRRATERVNFCDLVETQEQLEMEDTSNTPGNLRQERKCSTSLETKIAGFARDEVPRARMTSI